MKSLKYLLLTAASLLLAGCATTNECAVDNPHRGQISPNPSIEDITVENAVHGATVRLGADLRVPPLSNLRDKGATVRIRSTREPDLFFGPAFPMDAEGNNHYERSLYRLNYGPYEACVRATLGPAPMLEPEIGPDKFLTQNHTFFVGAAEPCEMWLSEGAGADGWTFDGIGGDVSLTVSEPFFGRTEMAGPGLTVLTGALSASSPSELWWFDYVSPDLENDENWQGLPEIVYRVNSNGNPVWVQSIFYYRDDEGELRDFAPVDEDGEHYFTPVSGGTTVYAPTMSPGDFPLVRIKIRIFGEAVTTTPEFFVHLGMVCPMPSRLPSLARAFLGELQEANGRDVVMPRRGN